MTKAEKREKLLATLRDLKLSGDIEASHSRADDALLEFINDKEVTEAYESLEKWYA